MTLLVLEFLTKIYYILMPSIYLANQYYNYNEIYPFTVSSEIT